MAEPLTGYRPFKEDSAHKEGGIKSTSFTSSNNEPARSTLSLGALVPILLTYNTRLPKPFIRLFRLSLTGLDIPRAQMREDNEEFKSFSTLFIDALYHKLGDDLQATVDFTCHVLNRFNCTIHYNNKYNLQQYASAASLQSYDMETLHPKVHRYLMIVETLYNMNKSERRQAIVGMAESMDHSLDRIDYVSEFVHHMCSEGRAPLGQPVPVLGVLNTNIKWTGTQPPDKITIYFRLQPRNTPTKRKVLTTLGVIGTVISLSAFVTLILWCIALLHSSQLSPPVHVSINGSYYDNQAYPVLLNSEGFIRNGSIKLTTTSSSVSIHQMDCNDIVTSNNTLVSTNHRRISNAIRPGQMAVNFYHSSRDPINLAPGSNITYTISSSYPTEHLPIPQEHCLKLYLFDSVIENDRFADVLNPIPPASVASTSCLQVGSENNSIISVSTFNITKQGAYFVQIQFPQYITFNITSIEVFQVSYNITNASLACEEDTLTSTQSCTIQTCNKLCLDSPSSSRLCLFASLTSQEDSGSVSYQPITANYQLQQGILLFIGIGSCVVFMIALIVFLGSGFYFCVMCLKPHYDVLQTI